MMFHEGWIGEDEKTNPESTVELLKYMAKAMMISRKDQMARKPTKDKIHDRMARDLPTNSRVARKIITKEQEERIIAAYLAGVKVRTIAAEFGVGDCYPTHLAKRRGIPLRQPHIFMALRYQGISQ